MGKLSLRGSVGESCLASEEGIGWLPVMEQSISWALFNIFGNTHHSFIYRQRIVGDIEGVGFYKGEWSICVAADQTDTLVSIIILISI